MGWMLWPEHIDRLGMSRACVDTWRGVAELLTTYEEEEEEEEDSGSIRYTQDLFMSS